MKRVASARPIVIVVVLFVAVILAVSVTAPVLNVKTNPSVAPGSGGAANVPSTVVSTIPAAPDTTSANTASQRVVLPAGSGGEATSTNGGPVHGVLLDHLPLPDAHTQELRQRESNEAQQQPDPLTVKDLHPLIRSSKPETPPATVPANPVSGTGVASSASSSPDTPDSFMNYETSDLGGGASLIGEPSQASASFVVLETWNWGVGVSNDAGKTWKYLDPYSIFPNSYGGFCCDQSAYYDQSHGIMFWTLQYSPDTNNNNAIRLAWANGMTNISQASFCYTDFTPQQLGSPTGTNYDQPKLARSNNDIYLEMTQYGAASGSIIIRIAASAFTSACGGIGYQWYAPGLFSPGFTQRAYSTMYFAAHVSNSTLRVFAWPESASNWTGITTHDVSHTAYPENLPYSCPRIGGSSTSDWCQRRSFGGGWAHTDRIFTGWVAGGVITFFWDASQGNNGIGGFNFPYPYVHVVRIDESTFALINEPVQWSSSFAIQYASAALDDRLHVAGTVMWGGGYYYENCATWIADDQSPGYTGIGFFPSGIWEWYNGPNSNIDPNDTLSGDYLSARRDDLNPYSWGGSCYTLQNNGSGGVSVHPYYLWFGRSRDFLPIRSVFLPNVMN